jgi:hypothetical protein
MRERKKNSRASLEATMANSTPWPSPNWKNFVAGSKHSIHSGMDFMDNIMALKDGHGFKYVHDNQSSRQSKDK